MSLHLTTNGEAACFSDYLRIDEARSRFEVDQRAYSDSTVFERERETIFAKCWLFIGHESEIRNPKDFITRNVAGFDLIFNRDRKGKIHAFYNYCTHRASTLQVKESGCAGVFTCPYHGWVFDCDGALRDQGAAYGYPKDFNSDARYNLKEVARVEGYRGFYFINFDEGAISLDKYLGNVKDIIDLMVDQSEKGLEVIGGQQHVINGGNWKVIPDNFVDMYHGPALHSSYFAYIPKRTGNASVGAQFVGAAEGLGRGHNLTETSVGFGRPVSMWIPAFGDAVKPLMEAKKRELLDRHGDARGERMASYNRNMTIFPNMVVTDNMSLSIRTVFPDRVDSFRMNIWALGCVDEPPAIREVRLRNHLTFIGPAGFAHPDDFEIFELAARAARNTPHKWLDYSKGMATDTIVGGDRRTARGEFFDEAQQRAWWTQWDRFIAGVEIPG